MNLTDKIFKSSWPECVLIALSLTAAVFAGSLFEEGKPEKGILVLGASLLLSVNAIAAIYGAAHRKGMEHWSETMREEMKKCQEDMAKRPEDWWKSEKEFGKDN